MKTFKPQLAPNEKVDLSTLNYPLLASTKLDGIRCIFYKGQILSRSLKQIQNKQLRERFEVIRAYTEKWNFILDGEIYSPKLNFQEITHFVMTQDLGDEVLPDHLKFHCFDAIREDKFNEEFRWRIEKTIEIFNRFSNLIELVFQIPVHSAKEVESYFEEVLKEGYEGLILRKPSSGYKFGRLTVASGDGYKLKPFVTLDAKIVDIIPATKAKEGTEKTMDELGHSHTSKKKDDREEVEMAGKFIVMYKGKELGIILAMDKKEKIKVWKNKKDYIGKWIEYKCITYAIKDLPKNAVFVRWRKDKDG